MKRKGKRINIKVFGLGMALLSVFLVNNLLVEDSYGRDFLGRYSGKYDECVNESNYGYYRSVYDYACVAAARTDTLQEGCAAWLSAPGSPGSTTIDIPTASGVAPLAVYGMCSDNSGDTTKRLWIADNTDNGSITFSTQGLERGPWGEPKSIDATLDIARFISGLTPEREGDSYVYTREVILSRERGSNNSQDWEPAIIKVRVGDYTPPPVGDLCELWTPESYINSNELEGTTSVNIKIRNTAARFNGVGYGDWNDAPAESPIYAKPGDTLEWFTCYYPGVQATHETQVSSVSIDGGEQTKVDDYKDLSKTECMKPLPEAKFKELKEAVTPWENYYGLSGWAGALGPFNADVGDIATSSQDVYYETSKGSAGTEGIQETASTGKPIYAKVEEVDELFEEVTTATGVCKNEYKNGPLYEASVTSGPASDTAYANVPYNFTNSISVSVKRTENGVVYAGDKITLDSVYYRVEPRDNGATKDKYATQVPNAKFKLVAYVSDSGTGSPKKTGSGDGCGVVSKVGELCVEVVKETETTTLNSAPNLSSGEYGTVSGRGIDGSEWFKSQKEYNVFDAEAGKYMCFVAAIWPASSGGDTNMTGSDGNWQYSAPSCLQIAKKPTFQVWGGSLYSEKGIVANVSTKDIIYKNYLSNKWEKFVNGVLNIEFMSWVEESLVLKEGVTSTVASGAATGLNSNKAGAGNKASFSKMSALSFANYGSGSIGTDEVGNSGIDSNLKENKDREALIDYWTNGDTTKNVADGGHLNLGSPGSMAKTIPKDNAIIRFSQGGNFSVSGTVVKGVTHLVKSSGTVTIDGNIRYDDSGYTQISEIPKVIIYAKDIKINCNVNRIDAILITSKDGNTTTCSGAGDYNDSNRSKQLRIFGVAITDVIDLGRTYGNAANSTGAKKDDYDMPSDGAAAEIFDYDTSIFMWAQSVSGSANTDVIQTAYQHEVAPRY